MYYQRAELPKDNTVCRTVPPCITQQVQTGGKCSQRRGLKSPSVSLHKKHALNIIRIQLGFLLEDFTLTSGLKIEVMISLIAQVRSIELMRDN